MKYTRSAAQKSQQQLRHQIEQEEQIETNIKSSKNKRKSLNNSKNKSKSPNKTKQSGRKSTSKKKKSKYFSDSEDDYDNNANNYDYEDDVDVGDEYYEAGGEDDYNYESYINTNKKKAGKIPAPIAEDEKSDEDDVDIEFEDENTQDTNFTRKSQSSDDNDYFNIFDGDSPLPELKLPKSSQDLLIQNENILDCISVYETLRRFRNILRLSPFLFEDFCACLSTNENSSLFSEVHLSLIRILLKEDEVNLVSYGPTDLKTCIDVSFHLIDSFTWPEILRQYIESDVKMFSLNLNLLSILNKSSYPLVSISDKLTVLNSLCNMFLSSLAVRNDLLSEGNIVSDDHCRICHKLGNLLCCETCPATYHLDCLDPPLTNVPEDDWICSICRLHQLRGVTDCLSEVEKTGLLIRHESLGYDRHKRKYWFLCRRIIVETVESGNYNYYSTKLQLDELIKTFDPTKFEAKLIRNINEQYEEIVRCMQITEELTRTRKESKKSYFDDDNERIRKLNEESHKEEEEEEILTVQDEILKIENSDDDFSNNNFNEEVEEYYQKPQNNGLNECDQLDGIVDNINNEVDDDEEHELLPSNLRTNGHHGTGGIKLPMNQKIKILNDQTTTPNDISQAITLLNKDSSRYKLSIMPNNTNSSQVKITTTINNSNMLQDYEFGDSLKFITNIKPNITSLDSESYTPAAAASTSIKIKDERPTTTKSEKLISTIFENLIKGTTETTTTTSSKATTMAVQPLYKLGMESNYRMYENQYSVNPLTMNKHQHNQERDRKNILSRRFSIIQEFNWKGNLFSNLEMLSKNISNTIIGIENSIPGPFMHHQWPKYREKWIKKLHNSRNVIDYAKCLLELEASMKPVLFVSAWKDGTGYIKLLKETQQEREEHKKEDTSQFKRRHLTTVSTGGFQDETSSYQATIVPRMAHFTKGIKHQVFKQKGEEYRLTGTGGWYWFHKTRATNRRTNNNNGQNNKNSQVKISLKNLLLNNLKDKKCVERILVEEENIPDADQPWFNNSLHPYLQVFDVETVDISENLISKSGFYPKEMRNKSKVLDFLLEKRLKINQEIKSSNEQLMRKLEEKLIDIEIVELKAKEACKQEETEAAVAYLEAMNVDEDEIKKGDDRGQVTFTRDYVRETMNLNEKVKHILDRSRISVNGEYLVELGGGDKELIRIPIVENNSKYRFKFVNKIRSIEKSNDSRLPPFSNFMINNKTTIFLFPRELTRLIARKGGFRIEIPGFKSDHHKQTVYWPYPCNRPLLKTCWCYKTFTAPNLSSLALQIRYFYSCIRWDAINERPPVNSHSYQGGIEPVLTEHFDDYMQITELIKKRNVGMYGLRSEYLVRKKKIPYKKSIKQSKLNHSSNSFNSTPNSSRTTSRRSGLRQLRQSIGQLNDSTGADTDSNSGGILDQSTLNQSNSLENKNKYQPIEEWIGEERLQLWQIKSFHDRSKRLEMEEIRKKDKLLKMQTQLTTNLVNTSLTNISKLSNTSTSSPKLTSQIMNQQKSTINILSSQFNNNHYKINQSPSPALNTKPILNMTKVIPRIATTTAITTTTSASPSLPLSNIRVFNASTSNLNKTYQMTNGQTVTVIAKPVQSQKQIIISSSPNLNIKTISTLTQNSFSNLKINNQSTTTTTSILSIPPPIIKQNSFVVQHQPSTPILTQTIATQIVKPLEIVQKVEPIEQISPPSNESFDPNSRSKRTRKLPAKLNDSYDLTYDTVGLNNIKSKPRPKSIQSILAQKEAEESLNLTIAKVNTILSAPSVSTKLETIVQQQQPAKHVVEMMSEEEFVTKSEQLLEDIAKRKRQELLQKHSEDLKEMIKYKKASMEVDIEESTRLEIDLDKYLELKSQYSRTPNEFVNKIKEIELEREENSVKEKKELIEKQQQKQLKQQKFIIKKEEIVNIISNNQNENEIINDIRHKRKSKLRPTETISPLSVSKENVQHESTEDVKKQEKIDNNENNKFEFLQQPKTIEESTNSQFEEEEEEEDKTETDNKKRKLSVTTTDSALLNSSECSSSGNNSLIIVKSASRINTNNKRHKLDSSMSDGEKQTSNKTKKTYCICNSAYDKKRFYIQCDKCANWYHGDCVNISPEMASTLETYKCVRCEEILKSSTAAHKQRIVNDKIFNKHGLTTNDVVVEEGKNLFCLCKKPYDEKRFYIGCDKCNDWCHGSCVGILPLEACTLDTYNCPTCLKKEGKEWNLENKITSKNYELIRNIFYTIKNNRMAWPFLSPVDATDVPNYYLIIKEPMDLSIIESRLLNLKYTKYIEFMYDMSKIIENCRLFNPVDSKFYKCANAIEKILVQQLKLLKERM